MVHFFGVFDPRFEKRAAGIEAPQKVSFFGGDPLVPAEAQSGDQPLPGEREADDPDRISLDERKEDAGFAAMFFAPYL